MGTKAKKAMHKSLKRINVKPSHPAADFLVCLIVYNNTLFLSIFYLFFSSFVNFLILFQPLDCGPARKLPELKPLENSSPVLYIGRIPHGFYELEMDGRCLQFLFLFFFLKECVYQLIGFCSLFWTIRYHQEIENCQE